VYTDKIAEDLSVEDLTVLFMAADKYMIHNLKNLSIEKLCNIVEVSYVYK
jgi:hypothetical protein